MDIIVIILRKRSSDSLIILIAVLVLFIAALWAVLGPIVPFWAAYSVFLNLTLLKHAGIGYIALGLILVGGVIANCICRNRWNISISLIQGILAGLILIGAFEIATSGNTAESSSLFSDMGGGQWIIKIPILLVMFALLSWLFSFPAILIVNSVIAVPFMVLNPVSASGSQNYKFFGQLFSLLGTCFLVECLGVLLSSLFGSGLPDFLGTVRPTFEELIADDYRGLIYSLEGLYYSVPVFLRLLIGAVLFILGFYMEEKQ